LSHIRWTSYRVSGQRERAARKTVLQIYSDFYKWPLQGLTREAQAVILIGASTARLLTEELKDIAEQVRDSFFSNPWYHPYDFVEFVANCFPYEDDIPKFTLACNRILSDARSAYRFVGTRLVRITSAEEIAAIETALATAQESQSLKPVHHHLKQAVTLLADRQSPDYPNSMKESISAVEALCKWLANDPKATLGSALASIERSKVVQLHPSLREAFTKLYGYTSDAGGIRHALKDEPDLDIEDAVFMLASCSAFVSYLTAKASKAGLLAATSESVQ
jgi:AbiJ N-terminal domain 4